MSGCTGESSQAEEINWKEEFKGVWQTVRYRIEWSSDVFTDVDTVEQLLVTYVNEDSEYHFHYPFKLLTSGPYKVTGDSIEYTYGIKGDVYRASDLYTTKSGVKYKGDTLLSERVIGTGDTIFYYKLRATYPIEQIQKLIRNKVDFDQFNYRWSLYSLSGITIDTATYIYSKEVLDPDDYKVPEILDLTDKNLYSTSQDTLIYHGLNEDYKLRYLRVDQSDFYSIDTISFRLESYKGEYQLSLDYIISDE